MKDLTILMTEGLLDTDFDVPDFDIEPIKANIPVGDDDGDWQRIVDKVNVSIEPFAFYTQINKLIDDVQELRSSMRGLRWQRGSKFEKISNFLDGATKLTKLDPEADIDSTTIKVVRTMNDWIGVVNKNSEFKKLATALSAYFYSSVGERSHKVLGTSYAHASWTLLSPNDNAMGQLQKIVDKFNKINPDIKVTLSKKSAGDGIITAALTKLPK